MTRAISAAMLLCMAATACATSTEPVEIPANEIPFPLERAEASAAPGVQEHSFKVMMVRGRRLVSVRRTEVSALPLPELAVRALLVGPTESELARGLSTAIPSTARLLDVQVFDDTVAEVNLSQGFQAAAPSEGFLLRVAQVVTTLTGVRRITAVRFSIDGEVASVPTDRGEIVQRPVAAADYARRLR